MGRTVPEMLDSVDSQELAEFQAYEMVNGPIGGRFQEDVLISIHEMLQQIGRILVAQHTEHREDIPDLMRYPRPADHLDFLHDEVTDDGE